MKNMKIKDYTFEEWQFKQYIEDNLNRSLDLISQPQNNESIEAKSTPEVIKQFDNLKGQNYYISKMILDIEFKDKTMFETLIDYEKGMTFNYSDFNYEVLNADNEKISFNIYNWQRLLVGILELDISNKLETFSVGEYWLSQPAFSDCNYISKTLEISVLLSKLNFIHKSIKQLEITTKCHSSVLSTIKYFLKNPNYEMWKQDDLVTDTKKREIIKNSYNLCTYHDECHEIICNTVFSVECQNGDVKLNGRTEGGNYFDDAVFSLQLRGDALANALSELKEQDDDNLGYKIFVNLAFVDSLQDIFLTESSNLFYFLRHDGEIVNMSTLIA